MSKVLRNPGDVLSDRYEVVRFLGAGGFAAVYEAHDRLIERSVAVKVLNLAALSLEPEKQERFISRFNREAKIAARIRHPNVVAIHDIGLTDDDEEPFLVMELLEGHDLEHELIERGPMAPARAVSLMVGCLEALGEGHQMGVIHKDLKPANLFIKAAGDRRERMVVVDFGIACLDDGHTTSRLTGTGQLMGTPQYMAPEYASDQVVTPAVDVYQMGLILVEMLTGVPVVQASNVFQALLIHQDARYEIPPEVEALEFWPVIKRALSVDPSARFADGEAFAMALADASGFLRADSGQWSAPISGEVARPALDSDPGRWSRPVVERVSRGLTPRGISGEDQALPVGTAPTLPTIAAPGARLQDAHTLEATASEVRAAKAAALEVRATDEGGASAVESQASPAAEPATSEPQASPTSEPSASPMGDSPDDAVPVGERRAASAPEVGRHAPPVSGAGVAGHVGAVSGSRWFPALVVVVLVAVVLGGGYALGFWGLRPQEVAQEVDAGGLASGSAAHDAGAVAVGEEVGADASEGEIAVSPEVARLARLDAMRDVLLKAQEAAVRAEHPRVVALLLPLSQQAEGEERFEALPWTLQVQILKPLATSLLRVEQEPPPTREVFLGVRRRLEGCLGGAASAKLDLAERQELERLLGALEVASSWSVRVLTTPESATIHRGDEVLGGETVLVFKTAEAEPVRLKVSAPGFDSQDIEVGPTQGEVRVELKPTRKTWKKDDPMEVVPN